jgi:hypothetical protein
MNLRAFHMLFILIAIMGADLFGGWAIHDYRTNGDPFILTLGIVSMLGGLGLAIYVLVLVRKLDREHIG